MRRLLPSKEPYQSILEYEDDTDSSSARVSTGVRDVEGWRSMPYLALKRRKLVVISGMLKPGRLRYLMDVLSTSL